MALRIISEVCNEQGLSVIVPALNAAYDNLEKIKEISEVTIHNVMSGDELGAYLSLKSLKDMTDASEEALTRIVIGDVDSDIIRLMQ